MTKTWSLFHWSPGKHNSEKKTLVPSLHYLPFPEQSGSLSRANLRYGPQEFWGYLTSSFILEVQKDHQKTPQSRVTSMEKAYIINFCCDHETSVGKCLSQNEIRISLVRNAAEQRVGVDWKQDTFLHQPTPPELIQSLFRTPTLLRNKIGTRWASLTPNSQQWQLPWAGWANTDFTFTASSLTICSLLLQSQSSSEHSSAPVQLWALGLRLPPGVSGNNRSQQSYWGSPVGPSQRKTPILSCF